MSFAPLRFTIFFMCGLILFSASLRAQETALPQAESLTNRQDVKIHDYTLGEADDTHDMLRLTPDKSMIVKLGEDAQSIIVGNPAHLNVLMDTPRSLVLVGRAPGATHFSALGKKGRVIMQRHVIVAGPKEKYVRIRRSCINAGEDADACTNTRIYFCPDMCHEIALPVEEDGGGGSGAAGGGGEEELVSPDQLPQPVDGIE